MTLGFACRAGVSVLISGYILGEVLVRLVLHYDVTSFLTHGTELKKKKKNIVMNRMGWMSLPVWIMSNTSVKTVERESVNSVQHR